MITNQNGFSMLSLSFLLPILFFSCMVILASYHMITKYTEVQNECRSHVLKAQQDLGKKLVELINLNPDAQKLRAEEVRLKAIIASLAATPPAAVPFVEALEINKARQAFLRLRQEKIIFTANLEAKKEMGELPFKIKNAQYSSPSLKIYKSPAFAIAPDHLPMPFFTELQTIKVNWSYPIEEFVPTNLLKLFSATNYPLTIQGKCAATLIKKGNVWNPKLHLAKF
jgi:hypothetical protein